MEVKTIEVDAVLPTYPFIDSRELKRKLAQTRGRGFSSETYRQWRKIAQVKSRGLYTNHEAKRLGIVAMHLRNGGGLKDTVLLLRIKNNISEEEKIRES